MNTYRLPAGLDGEINRLEELIGKYKKGEISPAELKAHRVPFGVYEQREPGTYMVRIRCPGGIVTPPQLEQAAAISLKYGIRDLHITTRQELQIHYAKLDDLVPIIRELKEAGLATRGGGGNTVRNIAAQEDAGVDPAEVFDVTPYVLALTSRLIAESDSWSLPRKFKIAFSGSSEDKGYATLADAGFIAVTKNGEKGFRVYAAGGLGAKSETGKLLLDFVGVREVYPVARALKNLFGKYGNRKNKHAARLRFLWKNLGAEEFKKRFDEEYAKIKTEGFAPLEDAETPSRSTGVSGALKEQPAGAAGFALWKRRFVRPQKQPGLCSVWIAVRLGFISCEPALRLASFLKPFGDDTVRLSKDQNFLLRNIPEGNLADVYNFVTDHLKDNDKPALYGQIQSCAGASTCQLGICLSRQAAKAVMKELEKSGLDLDAIGELKLNISGCPNSCGQHPAADIGFFGKALRKDGRLVPAYTVLAGALIGDGRTKLAESVGEVSAKKLPVLVKDLLGVYLSKTPRVKNFREYIALEGKEDLKKICERHREIPAFDEDKNFYFDWDSETVFSLAERRAGECSAGYLDLIEADLARIRETENKLSSAAPESPEKGRLISELVFYSGRMLLITRGVEPKTAEEAAGGFLRYFVETGIVEASFRDLLILAVANDLRGMAKEEARARLLAGTVVSLYENMDNAFNFEKTSAPAVGQKEENAVSPAAGVPLGVPAIRKDLRGVVCPLNFVKTKVELARLKRGELLEIWLDDGAPIENVPGSVKAEGHRIASQIKTEDYWRVLIEKK